MIKFLKNLELNEYLLIVPSVSVGNVAQLTVEILLNTLKPTKLGYVWHKNILPAVVNSEIVNGIATACELYVCEELKIVVMQIRSTYGPFVSISDMFQELCASVKCVIILTGGFAYQQRVPLVEQPFRHIASSNFTTAGNCLLPTTWTALGTGDNLKVRVPGSGIADHLFNQCVRDNVPVLLLIEFVSEGDNRRDAEAMANYVDELLKLRARSRLNEQRWMTPAVWDFLFGNTFPMDLF